MVHGFGNTKIASKSIFRTIGLVLLLSVLTFRVFPTHVQAATPPNYVVVNENHMHGWAFVLTDVSGTPYHTGGDYTSPTGTAQFVNGPTPTPDGTGSANLAVGDGISGGDGSAQIGSANFDGTLLSALTTLSYYAYSAQNNGQQFPYLSLTISTGDTQTAACSGTGGIDPTACAIDKLFFEPPYQSPGNGGLSCANQSPTVMNMWQNWDALNGCWWDDNNVQGSGAAGIFTVPLSTIEATYPHAVIKSFTATNNPYGAYPTQGLAFAVGYTSPTDIENGNVDNFLIGISGATTHYDFEHIVACPQDEGDTAKQHQHEELCEEKGDNGEHGNDQGNDVGEQENEQSEQDQHNSDASGENLSNADYSGYNFANSNLQGTDLSGSDLTGVNLAGADLSCADLSNADLSGANLLGAIIGGANLAGANLQGVDLSSAITVGNLVCQ
jgi:hypothetical protein